MVPTELVLEAATQRLGLRDVARERFLPEALAAHAGRRAGDAARELLEAVREAGDAVPEEVRRAADRLGGDLLDPSIFGEGA